MRTSFDWHKLLRGENRFNVGKMCHAARQPTTNYGQQVIAQKLLHKVNASMENGILII